MNALSKTIRPLLRQWQGPLTEELVRQLNPQHNLIAQAKPFLRRTRMDRLRPRRVLTSALEFTQELGEAARELPAELRRIITQIKTGQTRVNFRHEGLEPATNAFAEAPPLSRIRHARNVAHTVVSVGPPSRCTMFSEVVAIGSSRFGTEA